MKNNKFNLSAQERMIDLLMHGIILVTLLGICLKVLLF
jgi:hypothetical protein